MSGSRGAGGVLEARGSVTLAAPAPRAFFRPRQFILRDGDRVRSFTLKPWMQKTTLAVFALSLGWAALASLLFVYQARETEASDSAYLRAAAELAGQQRRITDLSRGLEEQRAAVARLIQGGAAGSLGHLPGRRGEDGHPVGALESELSGLLGQMGNLQDALMGMRGALDGADRERVNLVREREQLILRLREAERQAAQAHAAQEELLNSLGRRTRATVAEVERILGEAGLDAQRLLPPARPERRRGTGGGSGGPQQEEGGRGGPFVAAGWFTMPTVETRLHDRALNLQSEVEYLNRLAPLLHAAPLSAPVLNYQVESGFGRRRDPFTNAPALHAGLDLSSHHGAPIFAAGAGRVVNAGWEGAYGRMVEIDHGFGIRTRYAHLSAITVQEGAEVKRGQRIGRMGSTGRSTGTHLHYEVLINGRHVNPARFILSPAKGESHVRQ